MNDARLHPRLQLLLEDLRARIRRYVWLDWVLLAAAVLLVGFWLGLAIDYLPVLVGGSEMPRAARRLWLLVVVAGLIYGTVKTLIARLRRPLPDDSLALLLERQHPDLGGKLLTSVQLRPQTGEDATHSESLLEAVHEEAVSEIDSIDPKRVFQNKPLFQKAGLVAPLGIATIGLCIIAPQTFLQAASRLTLLSDSPWPRQARLEMVGLRIPILYADNESSPDESSTSVDRPVSQTVEFIDGVARVPRGAEAALEIRATAEEPFKVPDVCTLRYRRVNDNNNFDTSTMVMRGQTSLRRIGRVADGYQKFVLDASPIQPIATSMSITVFGLDDRLSDFRIETIEPPAIQNVRIECEYPDYLKWDDSDLAEDDTAAITTLPYRAGIRLPEGSRVRVIGESTKPLGTADVAAIQAGDRTPHSVEITDDGMSISIELADFSKATTVTVVPQDLEGIQAQSPFKFFIGIVLDQPPEVSMRLRGIGSAVTPIAKMPVEIETKDDYG
ncbi:MAG: polyketide synthase, partial [Planctomycetota bacterium]